MRPGRMSSRVVSAAYGVGVAGGGPSQCPAGSGVGVRGGGPVPVPCGVGGGGPVSVACWVGVGGGGLGVGP